MSDKKQPTESNVSLRSPLEAYSPLIVVGIIILFALVALFTNAGQVGAPEPTPAPPSPRPQVPVLTDRVEAIVKRTEGKWDKASQDERTYLDSISQGHGRQYLEMRAPSPGPSSAK